jgi:hypothetical protein
MSSPTQRKANPDGVRASRDGDQFHYHWAALRCLRLLEPGTHLAAVTIEGVSLQETALAVTDGIDSIDVAEYHGGLDLTTATRIEYFQLKHSTFRANEEWTASGLRKALTDFSARSVAMENHAELANTSVAFHFVTNRPVSREVKDAIAVIGGGGSETTVSRLIRSYLKGSPDQQAVFCRVLSIDDDNPDLSSLQAELRQGIGSFVPTDQGDEMLRLVGAVTERATTQNRHPITKTTVFAAFRTYEGDLLPAPSLIERPKVLLIRDSYRSTFDTAKRSRVPVIVHASGGVGKSAFTQFVRDILPASDAVVIYDCFGNGGYRSRSKARHEHRQGLVQIANEMASQGLCPPLIPGGSLPATRLAAAFHSRILIAASNLQARGSRLVILIDAADNAVMAARENGYGRAFVSDLLHEDYPENVSLIVLSRTERVEILDAPRRTLQLELRGFSESESAGHLGRHVRAFTEADAAEFHRRSFGNPRVQKAFLADQTEIGPVLTAASASTGTTAGDVLDNYLSHQIDELLDDHSGAEIKTLKRIFEVLAACRPRIPIDAITALSGADASLLMTVASSLRGSLIVDEESIQFRDEPTETFFRTHLAPKGPELERLLLTLRPLAGKNSYAATTLPQVLWENERFDDLVQLALSDESLPSDVDVERRQIERLRTEFALRAALSRDRWSDGAKLAARLGAMSGSHTRRMTMFRRNADLAGIFLSTSTIEELVAARAFRDDVPGFSLPQEGLLKAVHKATRSDGRALLRAASRWLSEWSRLPDTDTRRTRRVSSVELSDIGLGLMTTDDPASAIAFVQSWKPSETVFECALSLSTRLADLGRFDEVCGLIESSATGLSFKLGALLALNRSGRGPTSSGAKAVRGKLRSARPAVAFNSSPGWDDQHDALEAVCSAITASLAHRKMRRSTALRLIQQHLPPRPGFAVASQHDPHSLPVILAFALESVLRTGHFKADDLLAERSATNQPSTGGDSSRRHFQANIRPLVPWINAWLASQVSGKPVPRSEVQALVATLPKHIQNYEVPFTFLRHVTILFTKMVAIDVTDDGLQALEAWLITTKQRLYHQYRIQVIRLLAGRPGTESFVIEQAEFVRAELIEMKESADSKTDAFVALSRAVFATSPEDAEAYFDIASDVADEVGDDVSPQFNALMATASASVGASTDHEMNVYRIGRVIESLEPFHDGAIDVREVVRKLSTLHAPAAVALSSRWRDRGHAYFDSTLPGLIANTSEARLALALSSLSDRISLDEQLQKLSPDGLTPNLLAHCEDLYRRSGLHAGASERFQQAATSIGVTVPTVVVPKQDHFVSTDASSRWTTTKPATSRLDGLNLATRDGLASALMAAGERGTSAEDVWAMLFALPRTSWAAALTTVHELQLESEWVLASLMKRLRAQPSLTAAVTKVAKSIARSYVAQHAASLVTKGYEIIPLVDLAALADLPRDEVLRRALRAYAQDATVISADAAFALTVQISTLVSPDEAATTLDLSLSQYDYLLEDSTGDGPVMPKLPANLTTERAWGGLIWAALADPSDEVRWRAAHAVRDGLRFGDQAMLEGVAAAAAHNSGESFADRRLPFYDLDAIWWLLLALDRAAVDGFDISIFAAAVKAFDDRVQLHLVIRPLLDRVQGRITSPDAALSMRPNSCKSEVQASPRHRRSGTRSSWRRDSNSYNFAWDFREKIMDQLAVFFDITADEVAKRASDVILDEWKVPGRGGKDSDPRRSLNVFSPYQETSYVPYGRTPVQDLDLYLSTHAVLEIAGRLARDVLRFQDPDDPIDELEAWTRPFLLTRNDDRWLSDLRAPQPIALVRSTKPRDGEASFIWDVRRTDFEDFLFNEDDHVNVHLTARMSDYKTYETVTVRSALAARTSSPALIRAMQTDVPASSFLLPDRVFQDESREPGFTLSGWVNVAYTNSGLDDTDPFAARISYPFPEPAKFALRMAHAQPNADRTKWTTETGLIAFRTVSWGNGQPDDGRHLSRDGTGVSAAASILDGILDTLDRDLVVQVVIRRRDGHDETFGWTSTSGGLDDYARVFRYRPDEGWSDFRGPLETRTPSC